MTTPDQPACLYLLADGRRHADADALATAVMNAAESAGAILDAGADITVVLQDLSPGVEAAVHAASTGFVALHGADAAGVRLAVQAGNPVIEPTAGALAGWLAAQLRAAA